MSHGSRRPFELFVLAFGFTVGLTVGLTVLASPVSAQTAPTPGRAETPAPAPAAPAGSAAAATTTPEAPKVKVERGTGGKKIYRITEEIRIEGKIQKPEAFFFYQKSSINYDWQELKQDFVPRILESVTQSPF